MRFSQLTNLFTSRPAVTKNPDIAFLESLAFPRGRMGNQSATLPASSPEFYKTHGVASSVTAFEPAASKPLSHKIFGMPGTTHRAVSETVAMGLGITTFLGVVSSPFWISGLISRANTEKDKEAADAVTHQVEEAKANMSDADKAKDEQLKQGIAAIDKQISDLERQAAQTDDKKAALDIKNEIEKLKLDRKDLSNQRLDFWKGVVVSAGGNPDKVHYDGHYESNGDYVSSGKIIYYTRLEYMFSPYDDMRYEIA